MLIGFGFGKDGTPRDFDLTRSKVKVTKVFHHKLVANYRTHANVCG